MVCLPGRAKLKSFFRVAALDLLHIECLLPQSSSVDPREANDLHGSIYSKFIAKLRIDFAQVSPLRELLPDRLLVKLVSFIGFEFDFVLEFTADDHVNFVAKPVTLALASELKPACVRDFGENGKAVAPISRHSRAAPPAFFGYELNRTLERYRREASLASGTPISLRGRDKLGLPP
ncbi:hypothetical protein ACVWZV_008682 [Bradyrhizobium sp. GM5.1]